MSDYVPVPPVIIPLHCIPIGCTVSDTVRTGYPPGVGVGPPFTGHRERGLLSHVRMPPTAPAISKRGSVPTAGNVASLKERFGTQAKGKEASPRDISVMSPGERARLPDQDSIPPSARNVTSISARKAQLGSPASSRSVKSPEEDERPVGVELRSGWLKRGGTGVLSAVFSRRFAVLYADPVLAFFEDEARQKPKGTWRLTPITRVKPTGIEDATIETPGTDGKAKTLKLRAMNGEGPAVRGCGTYTHVQPLPCTLATRSPHPRQSRGGGTCLCDPHVKPCPARCGQPYPLCTPWRNAA